MFKASSFLSMSCFSALPPGFLQVVITHLSMQVILQVLTWRHKTSQKRRCVAVKPLSSGLTCLVTLLNNTDFFFFFSRNFHHLKNSCCSRTLTAQFLRMDAWLLLTMKSALTGRRYAAWWIRQELPKVKESHRLWLHSVPAELKWHQHCFDIDILISYVQSKV